MTATAKESSAVRLNLVGSLIQDHADEAGWAAAQPLIESAHAAHVAGRYSEARTLITEAHAAAFRGADHA